MNLPFEPLGMENFSLKMWVQEFLNFPTFVAVTFDIGKHNKTPVDDGLKLWNQS